MVEKKSFFALFKMESKDALLYTIITFITSIGGFLVVPLFWQKLTPADYGIIAIIEMVLVFLPPFLTLSLDQSIMRFYYEWSNTKKRKEKIGSIWLLSCITTIIFGALFFLILAPLSKFIFPDVSFFPFIFMGIVIAVLSSFHLIPFSVIRIMKKPKVFAIYRISSFAIQMFFSVYLIIFLNMGVHGYIYSLIISKSIVLVGLLLFMTKISTLIIKKAHLREALQFSLPLIPASLVANTTSILDKFLLQQYAGLNTLGYYSVSLKFANIIGQLHSALKLSYGPFLFKTISDYKTSGNAIASKMTIYYIFPLLVVGLSINLFIDDFVILFGNNEYLPIINIVPFLVMVYLINSLNVYLAPGIVISKKTKLKIIPDSIQLVVILVSGVLLIGPLQITGVILSRFLSTIIFLLISIYITKRLIEWKNNYAYIILSLLTIIFMTYTDYVASNLGGFYWRIAVSVTLFLIFILTYGFYLKKKLSSYE